MGYGDVLEYCLNKPGAIETYPFDEVTLVIKIGTKMFALFGDKGSTNWVNLKCDPDTSLILRNQYSAITPGYHMDKRYWNTMKLDGSIPDEDIKFHGRYVI
ncbi:MAG: MmcQ/YjbR family DNA-binding protein [Armatimonadota bacterium]